VIVNEPIQALAKFRDVLNGMFHDSGHPLQTILTV
jgi:hypothetical protein